MGNVLQHYPSYVERISLISLCWIYYILCLAIQKKNYSEIVSELWSINAVEAEANKMLKANIPSSSEADKWFECKLNFITLDEDKGVEKKTPVFMLVHANTVNSAHDTLIEHMRGTMADYTIESVKETKIIDVYKYDAEN